MYAVLLQLTTTWQYLHQVELLAARERGGRLWWIPMDLFKWLLLHNRAVTNGQRLGISRGFYEHASFVGNKSNRIKERIPGCSLQVRFWFVRQARSCHDWKCDALELEVGWKSTSRPLGLLVPGLFWAPELVPRPLPVLELVPRPLSSPGTGSKASL